MSKHNLISNHLGKLPQKQVIIVALLFLLLLSISGSIIYFNAQKAPSSDQNSSGSSTEIQKLADMLQVNGNLDKKAALAQAQADIQRQKKIKQEAAKRNILVTDAEIASEEAHLIAQSNKATILDTLSRYGWNENDWKAKISADLLEAKLKDAVSKWRDYQFLMLRWDDPSKPKLSTQEAELKTTTYLNNAKQRLEKGEDINKVFEDLSADKSITKNFKVQGILNVQRVYSDSDDIDQDLKNTILSQSYPSVSSVISRKSNSIVLVISNGNNGSSTIDQILSKNQSKNALEKLADAAICPAGEQKEFKIFGIKIPSIVKNAYAVERWCEKGGYYYEDAVVTGKVHDAAGNPLGGVSVKVAGTLNDKTDDCRCSNTTAATTSSNSYNSSGHNYYINNICCFADPFKITATAANYTCNSYSNVSLTNGATTYLNFSCSPKLVTLNPPSLNGASNKTSGNILTYTGSASWGSGYTNTTIGGYWLDISSDPNFGGGCSSDVCSHKFVTGTSTTFSDGFSPYINLKADGSTYYIRVYNGLGHSNVQAFSLNSNISLNHNPECLVTYGYSSCTTTETWNISNIYKPEVCLITGSGLSSVFNSTGNIFSGNGSKSITIPSTVNKYTFYVKSPAGNCTGTTLASADVYPGTGSISLQGCYQNNTLCPAGGSGYSVSFGYSQVPNGAILCENSTSLGSNTSTNYSSPSIPRYLSPQNITYTLRTPASAGCTSGIILDKKDVKLQIFYDPWLKTSGGDVHSNNEVNTPGGP